MAAPLADNVLTWDGGSGRNDTDSNVLSMADCLLDDLNTTVPKSGSKYCSAKWDGKCPSSSGV